MKQENKVGFGLRRGTTKGASRMQVPATQYKSTLKIPRVLVQLRFFKKGTTNYVISLAVTGTLNRTMSLMCLALGKINSPNSHEYAVQKAVQHTRIFKFDFKTSWKVVDHEEANMLLVRNSPKWKTPLY